jgi:hypothetical protein
MRRESSVRTIAVVIVAVAAISSLAYWGYDTFKKHETNRTALSLVTDTGVRLREALNIEAGPPPADAAATLRKIIDHALEVDNHLQRLREMDTLLELTLFDAADSYVLTAREFLRKQVTLHRQRQLLADSMQALLDHRLRTSRRSATWIPEAVRAKERFEKNYREYRNADEAFGVQLDLFPGSQKKIAPHVDKTLLIEDSLIAAVRKRALESSKEMVAAVEKTRKVTSVR